MDTDGEQLRERLLQLLERKAPRPLSIPELARQLELERYDHRGLARLLDGEVALRKLRRVGKTRYQWLRPIDLRRAEARPARLAATTTDPVHTPRAERA
ncbi:hypothetical protein K2Z84_10340, partial [Candidatus Binatia bacterium]|nr:hypothetical protein [Candidatus Binatia bacterium]